VTSRPIFVYPLHLSVAKILTLITSRVLAVPRDGTWFCTAAWTLAEQSVYICRDRERYCVGILAIRNIYVTLVYLTWCRIELHISLPWPPVAMILIELALCWKLLALPSRSDSTA